MAGHPESYRRMAKKKRSVSYSRENGGLIAKSQKMAKSGENNENASQWPLSGVMDKWQLIWRKLWRSWLMTNEINVQ
jgi:hypothetical protein